MKKRRRLWDRLKVYFGFAVWVKTVYNRPRYQICPYHGCKMKRGRKTIKGALYWCPKCQTHYHLEGGGSKLVPV